MAEHEDQRFHNMTIELDGHAYRRCHFINCQVRFHGFAPIRLEDNRYEGAFWIHLLDDWRSMAAALDPLRRELRRYGANLDEVLDPPAPRPMTGWVPAVMPGQREMHIEYWFHREGKPDGGLRLINHGEDVGPGR
jgi:hypothetical protein